MARPDIPARDRGHGLISPHHLGYPQTRERFFIVGCRDNHLGDPFPPADRRRVTSLASIWQSEQELTLQDREETRLSDQQRECIDHWNALLTAIPSQIALPSFPMWGDEIGARYPFEDRTPWATPTSELRRLIPNRRFPPRTSRPILLAALPSYAREEAERFREWKVRFIRQNRDFFSSVAQYLPAGWANRLQDFPPSLRKLEWNVQGEARDLWCHVLQFRPSGLRAKRASSSPALVAMTTTQIPILGPKRRFLTRVEGLRLQGFPDHHALPIARATAFAALGNAVHVGVVREIAMRLLADAAVTPPIVSLPADRSRQDTRIPWRGPHE